MTDQPRTRLKTLCIILFIFSFFSRPHDAFAGVPNKVEPDFNEAVLALNGRDYDRALKIIDSINRRIPNLPEVLELKALTFKTKQEIRSAEQVYEELLTIKANAPVRERAPYYYELATIAQKNGNQATAQQYFERAIEGGFNVGVSHFFLGTYAMKDQNLQEAEFHFERAARSRADVILLPSNFYLGQVYLMNGYPSGASRALLKADELARQNIKKPSESKENKALAQQIHTAIEGALEPLKQNSWYATAGLTSSYDSNILSLPSVTSDTLPTGRASLKNSLSLGMGYLTGPLTTFQWTPSYRLSMNLNTNEEAKGGEFLSHIASLYATLHPLNEFSIGLKLEGTGTFQNQADESSRFDFRPLSWMLATGPYAKWEFSPRMTLGAEAFFNPQLITSDDPSDTSTARSGQNFQGRVFYQWDRIDRWFNPTLSGNASYNNTLGSSFRAITYGAAVSNLFYWTTDLRGSLSVDYSNTSFPSRELEAERVDQMINIGLSASYRLTRSFSITTDARWTTNLSTIPDTYAFDRLALTCGASIAL